MGPHNNADSRNSGSDSALSSSLSSGGIAARNLEIDVSLTFGLEIEFTFAVRNAINDADPDDPNDPYANHPLHFESDQLSLHFGEDNEPDELDQIWRDHHPEQIARELQQASTILFDRGGRIVRRYYPKQDIRYYDEWFVERESAAEMNEDLQKIISRLSKGKITDANFDKFTYSGKELVSRILDVPDIYSRRADAGPAMVEVRRMIEALQYRQGDDHLFMIDVENAGLHMHVGRPLKMTYNDQGHERETAQIIDARILKHLAYILIEYEHVISLLHNPERRGFPGTKTDGIAESNRVAIMGHQHSCGQYPLPTLQTVKAVIFDPTTTIRDLVQLMNYILIGYDVLNGNTRYKFVNWVNIDEDDESKSQTIEFRQHHGTMNTEDIEQWIIFNTSLVRAAQRMARMDEQHSPLPSPTEHREESSATSNRGLDVELPTSQAWTKQIRHIAPDNLRWAIREGKRYATRYENEDAQLDKLFDLLQLRKSRRTYWLGRLTKYRNPKHTSLDTYEACTECLNTFHPDNAAWAIGQQKEILTTLNVLLSNAQSQAAAARAAATGRIFDGATPDRQAQLKEELAHCNRALARAQKRVADCKKQVTILENIARDTPARMNKSNPVFEERRDKYRMIPELIPEDGKIRTVRSRGRWFNENRDARDADGDVNMG